VLKCEVSVQMVIMASCLTIHSSQVVVILFSRKQVFAYMTCVCKLKLLAYNLFSA